MKKMKNVSCISAPIRNYQGRAIAAFSISSPSFRINKNVQNNLKDALLSISEKISIRLGYNGKL